MDEFYDNAVQKDVHRSLLQLSIEHRSRRINELINTLLENDIPVNFMFQLFPEPSQATSPKKQSAFELLIASLSAGDLSPEEKNLIYRELVKLKRKKSQLSRMLIREFKEVGEDESTPFAWSCADYLYQLRSPEYLDDYIALAGNKEYGVNRQMLFLLLGSLQNSVSIPVILDNLSDPDVNGHALSALSKFDDLSFDKYFNPFLDDSRAWVRRIARKRLSK